MLSCLISLLLLCFVVLCCDIIGIDVFTYDFVNDAAAIINGELSILIQHQSGKETKSGTTKPELISTWSNTNIRENTAYYTNLKNRHQPTTSI